MAGIDDQYFKIIEIIRISMVVLTQYLSQELLINDTMTWPQGIPMVLNNKL